MEKNKTSGFTRQKRRGAIYGFIVGAAILVLVFGVIPRVFPPVQNIVHGQEIAYHAHVQVDYYVNGKQSDLPAKIGIDSQYWPTRYLEADGVAGYSPIHTHDWDSKIHIEPKDNKVYSFADFMKVWGNDKPYKLSYCLSSSGVCSPVQDPSQAMLRDGDHYKLEQ